MPGKHDYLYRVNALVTQSILNKALTRLIESNTLDENELVIARNELSKLHKLTEKRLNKYSVCILNRKKKIEEEIEHLESLKSLVAANGWSTN